MKKVDVVVMTRWRFAASVFFAAMVLGQTLCAGVGDWKSYTSMKNIRAVTAQGKFIWVATSGGVFRYNLSDSSFQQFTNSDGLSSNDVTAITADSFGNIWVGQANGSIDVYSTTTGAWRYVTDIYRSTKNNKKINALLSTGDSLYISTEFGISLFSISKFEFRESYSNFAMTLSPSVFSVQQFGGRLYAATSAGVFTAVLGTQNLAAPESWTQISNFSATSLTRFNDSLFVGTNNGLYKINLPALQSVSAVKLVRTLFATDSLLLFSNSSSIFSITKSGAQSLFFAGNDSATCGIVTNAKMYFGYNSSGINSYNGNLSLIAPSGPEANFFSSLVLDNNGVLWAASGKSNGKGFYSFDGVKWKNYNTGTSPLIKSNDCFAVALGPNNSKWISTWGSGLILVNSSGNVVRNYTASNSNFIGIPNDLNYLVPSKIAVDKSGNVWTSMYLAANQSKVLWKMSADSTWTPYPSNSSSYNSMLGVFVDQYNTKWFTNRLSAFPAAASAVFFNENNLGSITVNGWGNITTEQGLTNNGIYDIVTDKNGSLWIGTESGITIISDPKNPLQRISKVYSPSVRDQKVQCIAVDPLNNKWIGTTQGVYVLSPDGITLLQQYSVANTNGKLVDDNILDIAIDAKNGLAYFGTEKGLSVLEISTIQTQPEFTTLNVSPNPVQLGLHSQVEIRGLVDDSIIKILSITGTVIKQFAAQGAGRAFWDCKDENGNTIGSGVYIIAAHNSSGSQTKTAKVAVIHK